MTKRENNPKIAIIGPYPPPYGGISVHIQRLREQLDKKGVKSVIYNTSGDVNYPAKNIIKVKSMKRLVLRALFLAKEKVFHYHNSDWQMRVVLGLMGFLGKKTVISIHGVSLANSLNKGNWFRRRLIRFAIRGASFIIADNSEIEKLVLSLGMLKKRVNIVSAFIPPIEKEEDTLTISRGVWDFISSHKPVISANAFRIAFYNNQDLYGIDMSIELCASLKQHYPDIGFVFCIPDIGDYSYFDKMKQQIKDNGIEGNFLFQTKRCQFYPIVLRSNIFVRPTNTDGDPLSIREALYFKIPVIASDTCPRPEGVILFKNRDIPDFIGKTKQVLDNYDIYKNKASRLESGNGFDGILKIYNGLAK